MKKIVIILISLIALTVVGWFGVYQMKAPDIQADIKQRVGDALASNSLDWVSYDVDGRDVTLSGIAENPTMAQHAFDTANIYGLNSLQSTIRVAGNQPNNEPLETQITGVAAQQTPMADQDSESNASEPVGTEEKADVEVQDVATKKPAALPLDLTIQKDVVGKFIFNGVIPDTEFKSAVDQHLDAIGADPANSVWQVELSSVKAPTNWQTNVLNSISSINMLNEGSISLAGSDAKIKGIASTQNDSDAAEAFAQRIAGDFNTEMNLTVTPAASAEKAESNEELPLVGSDQYAAKFCQTEFNALLKQQKIVFESGASQLQAASTELLDKVFQVSNRCPNQVIQVHGYTDSRGKASSNWKLSKLRAEAVANYLAQKGMDVSRLKAIGHGEKNPIASNKTEAGRAKNRRITLIVKGTKK